MQPWYTEVVIPLVASLAFVGLAEKASRGFGGLVGAVFNNETLAQIGRMSYSIFLVHTFTELLLPHVGLLGRILDSNYRCLVLIPCTVTLANMAWRWIERPIHGDAAADAEADAAGAGAGDGGGGCGGDELGKFEIRNQKFEIRSSELRLRIGPFFGGGFVGDEWVFGCEIMFKFGA